MFGFSSKVEAQWLVMGQVGPVGVEVPPPVRMPSTKMRRGGNAPQGASIWWAPHSASVGGHGQGFVRCGSGSFR
jgi:hypothetical protein